MTYQQVIVVGNVGNAPELRYTQTGRAVCNFSLATNRSWTDQDTNERRKETTWYKVTVWGKQAETVNQYVQKGRQVLVMADRIEAAAYLRQDGTPAASLDITAQAVRFLADSTAAAPQNNEIPF